jgi:dTDP-4-dehydrorhamnose reductase
VEFSKSTCDVLIVGADSKLGKNFFEIFTRMNNFVTIGTTNKSTLGLIHCDLRDKEHKLPIPRPGAKAFIFSSKSNHEVCEKFPNETYEVNYTQTVELISYLNNLGYQAIIFSSTQVFSGNKPWMKIQDKQDPVSVFGKQKKELEDWILTTNMNLVIRVTKVLNPEDNPFKSWIHSLGMRKVITPFMNYPISPISMKSLMSAVLEIKDNFTGGLIHLGNAEQTDYANIAAKLATILEIDLDLINGIYPDPTSIKHIPKFSSLDLSATTAMLSWVPETIDEAVINSFKKIDN